MSTRNSRMIIGRHPVREALEAGVYIDRIFLAGNARGEVVSNITAIARSQGVPVIKVPNEKLQKLSRKNHQGIIALAAPVPFYRIADILPMVYEKGGNPLFLLLDGITDVRNFGAICRTAYCAGVQTLIISSRNTAAISEDTMKASAGALSKLVLCRENNLVSATQFLKENGLTILSMELNSTAYPGDISLEDPIAIVLGSEEKGVSGSIQALADHHIRLPMSKPFDSYNVSVSAGMILYEAMRQRGIRS
jgi:23S rRNA (guanosine2251-2'-O)-methyltransferase